MTAEELPGRAELRAMQRERERERRRMRDRQRRQSMSLEEREKHLARRRRNYQLRRQRTGNTGLDSQGEQTSIPSRGEQINRNEHQALISVSDLSAQHDGVLDVGFDRGQEKINLSGLISEGLEATAHTLAKSPRRIRLNHIRHLARSLNDPMSDIIGENHQIGADVKTRENAATNCKSPKSLRLSRVKRLARALNSTAKETSGQNHQNETGVEQNLLQGEIQLISNDVPKSALPDNIRGRIEQMYTDG
ncbi:hypothetical protein L1049_010144 [Liquidambar formosana]|uniref:Uncharacterized protein n=1 Tax=Liquidambar formosana TaxID=63359 RepID=A0AAP0N9A1_LIQFO